VKKIYLLATAVAILTGIAVYMFASSLQSDSNGEAVTYNMINVAAAASDIPVNTKITPEMVVLVEVPVSAAAEGTVRDRESLVGMTTKYPMSKGEYFFDYKTAQIPDVNNSRLADRIKEGYRAFTIYTDEITGMSGYLRIGDRIDIMVTIERPVEEVDAAFANEKTETITYYLMQDIPIIALGSAAQYAQGATEVNTYTSITVEVPANDCPMLNYYMSEGYIKLVLRGSSDKTELETSVYPSR